MFNSTLWISLLGIFLTVCLVIGIHEFGHFLAAKWLGIPVLRFSIGFGKPLFHFQDKSGTEYIITLFPLGGYVKLLDEIENTVPEEKKHLAFNRQSMLKKVCVILAGPLFNFLFAFLTYSIVFTVGITTTRPIIDQVSPHSISAKAGLKANQKILAIDGKPIHDWISATVVLFSRIGDHGEMKITVKEPKGDIPQTYLLNLKDWHLDDLNPDPISSLGITPFQPKAPTIIDGFVKESKANDVLKAGDQILAINGQPISDWPSLTETIKPYPEQTLSIKIKRQGKIMTKTVITAYKRNWYFQKEGLLGVTSAWKIPESLINKNKYTFPKALIRAYHEVIQFMHLNILIIGKLMTQDISIRSIAGPLSILASAGTALNLGIIIFLDFLAFISASLVAINLLPIPGLDGGYLIYLLIECVTRRPLSAATQTLLYRLGMACILIILFQGFINDLARLF